LWWAYTWLDEQEKNGRSAEVQSPLACNRGITLAVTIAIILKYPQLKSHGKTISQQTVTFSPVYYAEGCNSFLMVIFSIAYF
jgi:hypothetical protein